MKRFLFCALTCVFCLVISCGSKEKDSVYSHFIPQTGTSSGSDVDEQGDGDGDGTDQSIEDGWTLVWSDEFDIDDYIDESVWTKIPRNQYGWNNYLADYDELFDVKDGHLILRGINNESHPTDTARYLTGGLYTMNKRSFDGGRIAIRAKLQGAQGAWPAFWMKPAETAAQNKKGEIDIMERLNFDAYAYQTVHNWYTLYQNGGKNPQQQGKGTISPDGYNVYSVDIYEDRLVLSINYTASLTYPRVDSIDIEDQFPYFIHPFYLLVDMQLDGSWPGPVDPDDLPIEMWIDWVRYYK